jgi:hypothetical protein
MPAQPIAAKPPKGRLCFWISSNSDFRVTGNRASAARDVTATASTPARIFANAGAADCAWATCRANAANCARSRSSGSRVSSASK